MVRTRPGRSKFELELRRRYRSWEPRKRRKIGAKKKAEEKEEEVEEAGEEE